MNNKLFFGMALIIAGLSSLIVPFLPQSLFKYIFNWQVMMIIVGVYLILKKGVNNVAGIWVTSIGVYFYIKEFLPFEYNRIVLPILLIIIGVGFIALYFKDKNK
ncbi:MAG: hypothetical protein KGV54_00230 [Oceanivirga sp.]|nr:hypothetical protein [Oceanivirga sp.]